MGSEPPKLSCKCHLNWMNSSISVNSDKNLSSYSVVATKNSQVLSEKLTTPVFSAVDAVVIQCCGCITLKWEYTRKREGGEGV